MTVTIMFDYFGLRIAKKLILVPSFYRYLGHYNIYVIDD